MTGTVYLTFTALPSLRPGVKSGSMRITLKASLLRLGSADLTIFAFVTMPSLVTTKETNTRPLIPFLSAIDGYQRILLKKLNKAS